MVLNGQMKDINVNDINSMMGRYIDGAYGSGNELGLHDFFITVLNFFRYSFALQFFFKKKSINSFIY
jgi:hypothetical protein